MDHKEKHHLEHEKERERRKKEQKEHEWREERSPLPFHPAWLVAVGVGLILVAVLVWTLL